MNVYIKAQESVCLVHPEIKIKDIMSLYCTDKDLEQKIKNQRVYHFIGDHDQRKCFSILMLVEVIKQYQYCFKEGEKMSDMLSYEAVQLKNLLADEKTIKDKYIKAAESVSDPQLKEKLQKCAAVHSSHVSVIEGLTGEANDR